MENISFPYTTYPKMDIKMGRGGKKDSRPHKYNTQEDALVDAHAKGWRVVVRTTRGTYYFKAHRDHWTDKDVRKKIAAGSFYDFKRPSQQALFFFLE